MSVLLLFYYRRRQTKNYILNDRFEFHERCYNIITFIEKKITTDDHLDRVVEV